MPIELERELTPEEALAAAKLNRYLGDSDLKRLRKAGVTDGELLEGAGPLLRMYAEASHDGFLIPLTANYYNNRFREKINATRPEQPSTGLPHKETRSAILFSNIRKVGRTLVRFRPQGARNAA